MSWRRTFRGFTGVALAAAMVVLAGCGDDGPSGPGTLDGRVSAATDLGAVVLQVEGTLTSIEGAGDTRAFVGPTQGSTRRVILVGEGSGELRFAVAVDDLAAARPTVTVLSAVDTSNEDVAALSAIDVRLSPR